MIKAEETNSDYEWVQLLLDAKRLGITTEEIRLFLRLQQNGCYELHLTEYEKS